MEPRVERVGAVSVHRVVPLEPRARVFLVHGFGQNHTAFGTKSRSLIAHLAGQGFEVCALDLRGANDRASAPRALRDHVSDVDAVLARFADGLATFLVGHSMGGLISYFVSSARSVDGVVSIGTPYTFGRGSLRMSALASIVHALGGAPWPALPLRWVGHALRRTRPIFDHPRAPVPLRVWRPGGTERSVLTPYLESAFSPATIQIARDIVTAERSPWQAQARASFEASAAPLLVVAGSYDDLAPAASVRSAFDRSRTSDKTYRVYPLGHVDLLVGREATSTVWPLLIEWLTRRAEGERRGR